VDEIDGWREGCLIFAPESNTSWVNFIHILQAAFTCEGPKRSQVNNKRQSCHQCHFALLGPAHVKAARKTLMKLTPRFNFIFSIFSGMLSSDRQTKKQTYQFCVENKGYKKTYLFA